MREYNSRILNSDEKDVKKFDRKTIYISCFIFFMFLFLSIIFQLKILIFITLVVLVGVTNYHLNLTDIRMDIGLEVFFSLLLTYGFSLTYGFLLILFAEFIPDIYTARLDKDTVLSIILTVLINVILSKMKTYPFVGLGLILVTGKFILSLIINLALGFESEEIVFETGLNFVSNIFFFMILGDLLINFLN